MKITRLVLDALMQGILWFVGLCFFFSGEHISLNHPIIALVVLAFTVRHVLAGLEPDDDK